MRNRLVLGTLVAVLLGVVVTVPSCGQKDVIAALEMTISDLEAQISQLNDKIGAVETELAGSDNLIETQGDTIAELADRLGTVSEDSELLAEQYTALESAYNQLLVDLDAQALSAEDLDLAFRYAEFLYILLHPVRHDSEPHSSQFVTVWIEELGVKAQEIGDTTLIRYHEAWVLDTPWAYNFILNHCTLKIIQLLDEDRELWVPQE